MGLRSLVSVFLVLIPIAVPLAVLITWDQVRISQGYTPIFQDNTINREKYCQATYGITPDTVGQVYTLNPNQWNWDRKQGGGLCMNVVSWANGTYDSPYTAPKWSITWQYPQGPADAPVHAFPNAALEPANQGETAGMPAKIQDIKSVHIKTKWMYGVGRKPSRTLDIPALTNAGMRANVAIDMFLDDSASISIQNTKAKYEVMVWLGQFGEETYPIGFDPDKPASGAATTRTVGGTAFTLYYGQNSLGQHVYTWVAGEPTTEFSGSVSDLLEDLSQFNGPGPETYLGHLGMGSETYWSLDKVTLNVPLLQVRVKTR